MTTLGIYVKSSTRARTLPRNVSINLYWSEIKHFCFRGLLSMLPSSQAPSHRSLLFPSDLWCVYNIRHLSLLLMMAIPRPVRSPEVSQLLSPNTSISYFGLVLHPANKSAHRDSHLMRTRTRGSDGELQLPPHLKASRDHSSYPLLIFVDWSPGASL